MAMKTPPKSTSPTRSSRSYSASSLLPSSMTQGGSNSSKTPSSGINLEDRKTGSGKQGGPGIIQKIKRISMFPSILLNRRTSARSSSNKTPVEYLDVKQTPAAVPARNTIAVSNPLLMPPPSTSSSSSSGKHLTCYFCQKQVFFPSSISLVQCKNCGKNIMQTIANLKVGILMGANAAKSDGSLYVRLSLSGQAARTRIVKGGAAPKWEEEFLL